MNCKGGLGGFPGVVINILPAEDGAQNPISLQKNRNENRKSA